MAFKNQSRKKRDLCLCRSLRHELSIGKGLAADDALQDEAEEFALAPAIEAVAELVEVAPEVFRAGPILGAVFRWGAGRPTASAVASSP